jgi:hypothetical protein
MATISRTRKLIAAFAVLFAIGFLADNSTRATEQGAMTLAQAQMKQAPATSSQAVKRTAPTKLTAPGKGIRKDCNGQSSDDCCKGLDYCGCLYPPMGGKSPTACFAGEPPKDKPKN